jgi:hypothetical protein
MTLPKLYGVVWKLRDEEALRREIGLVSAKLSDPEIIAEAILAHFWKEIQSHPLEWPSSSRPPSEHTWRLGRVMVRYRLIPDAQTVEIISVTSSNTQDDAT